MLKEFCPKTWTIQKDVLSSLYQKQKTMIKLSKITSIVHAQTGTTKWLIYLTNEDLMKNSGAFNISRDQAHEIITFMGLVNPNPTGFEDSYGYITNDFVPKN